MSLNVLLVCGSGASSGFMAANMRKAAKKRALDYKIQARSESELESYVNEIDILMIGPHLAYMEQEVKSLVDPARVTVILMQPDYYSILDGNQALDHLQKVLESN